jgi:hypothetical protein
MCPQTAVQRPHIPPCQTHLIGGGGTFHLGQRSHLCNPRTTGSSQSVSHPVRCDSCGGSVTEDTYAGEYRIRTMLECMLESIEGMLKSVEFVGMCAGDGLAPLCAGPPLRDGPPAGSAAGDPAPPHCCAQGMPSLFLCSLLHAACRALARHGNDTGHPWLSSSSQRSVADGNNGFCLACFLS